MGPAYQRLVRVRVAMLGRLRGRPTSATELMAMLGRPVDSWAMRPGKEDGARAGPARGGRPSRLLCSVWAEGTCGARRRVGPVTHLGLAGHVLGPDWLSFFLNKPRLLY